MKPTVETSKVYPNKAILEIPLTKEEIVYTNGTATNKIKRFIFDFGISTEPSLSLIIINKRKERMTPKANKRLVPNCVGMKPPGIKNSGIRKTINTVIPKEIFSNIENIPLCCIVFSSIVLIDYW